MKNCYMCENHVSFAFYSVKNCENRSSVRGMLQLTFEVPCFHHMFWISVVLYRPQVLNLSTAFQVTPVAQKNSEKGSNRAAGKHW